MRHRFDEVDLMLGVALGVVLLGALTGAASAAPRVGAPKPAPKPGPTPAEQQAAASMTLEPGHQYEAIIKVPEALAPVANASAVAAQILAATGMRTEVTQVDETRWRAVGIWTGPSTPIKNLPPEVEWIREV